jgi:hypothetical protein
MHMRSDGEGGEIKQLEYVRNFRWMGGGGNRSVDLLPIRSRA